METEEIQNLHLWKKCKLGNKKLERMLISQQATLTPLAVILLLIHLISDKGGLIYDLSLKQRRGAFFQNMTSQVSKFGIVSQISGTLSLS